MPSQDYRDLEDDSHYVVELNGRRTIVKTSVSDWDPGRVHLYECGDEQGWRLPRKDLNLRVVRKIRL